MRKYSSVLSADLRKRLSGCHSQRGNGHARRVLHARSTYSSAAYALYCAFSNADSCGADLLVNQLAKPPLLAVAALASASDSKWNDCCTSSASAAKPEHKFFF